MALPSLALIRASNGSGEAVRSIVTGIRIAGSTVLAVDALTNWPTSFIATSGSLLSDGTLDPTSVLVFYGHTNVSQIIIDGFAPSYTDNGNSAGQVVVVKPATLWANNLANLLAVNTNDDGTPKSWTPLSVVPTLSATNGNRSFNLTYPGVDYTDRLSKNMRLLIPRTGSTPTQSANLNGTTQYASKTSPTGLAFTTQFSVEAWINLSTSSAGTWNTIVSRRSSSTLGWAFNINTNGQVYIFVGNTTTGTFVSNAAVPVGKKVHVAATVNLSGTTSIYIDGVLVTSTATGSTTTLSQTGNLAIGARPDTLGDLFSGQVSDVRVWSSVRTQQQILDNMNQQLVGNETGLVGYHKLNGDFNDSTSNANNLVPAGSATATYADNPFNANAYVIIMSPPVYSGGNTTMTVQAPEGYPIPNQTLGTSSYGFGKPFGFPAEPNKWRIISYAIPGWTMVAPGSGSTEDVLTFSVPVGSWQMAMMGHSTLQRSTAGQVSGFVRLYNASYDYLQDSLFTNASVTNHQRAIYRADIYDFPSMTVFTLQAAGASGLTASILEAKPQFRCWIIPANL